MTDNDQSETISAKRVWLTTKRRVTLAVSLLVVVAVGLMVINQIVKSKTTETVRIADVVTSIEVDVSSGDVTLVDAKDLAISRKAEYVFKKPSSSAKVKDGLLRLKASCSGLRLGECSVGYTVGVPPSVPVVIKTDSGKVGVRGVKSSVRVSTKSASVAVESTYGGIDVNTKTGSVTGTSLSSRNVSVLAVSGSINIRFAVAPSAVTATSSTGDVRITVPKSSTTYNVDAVSTAGKTVTEIGRDVNSPFTLAAHSNSGDVTVEAK